MKNTEKVKQVISNIDNSVNYHIEIDGKEIIKGGAELKLYIIANMKLFTDEAWEVLLGLEQPQIVSKPKKKKNGNL